MSEPCVDAVACPICGGIGSDRNANFWCSVCKGEGHLPARLRHYEVASPELTAGGYYDPPESFVCFDVFLARSPADAKSQAVRSSEFAAWVKEARSDVVTPFKGLRVRRTLCPHGVCWACASEDDAEAHPSGYACAPCDAEAIADGIVPAAAGCSA